MCDTKRQDETVRPGKERVCEKYKLWVKPRKSKHSQHTTYINIYTIYQAKRSKLNNNKRARATHDTKLMTANEINKFKSRAYTMNYYDENTREINDQWTKDTKKQCHYAHTYRRHTIKDNNDEVTAKKSNAYLTKQHIILPKRNKIKKIEKEFSRARVQSLV